MQCGIFVCVCVVLLIVPKECIFNLNLIALLEVNAL